MTSARHELPDEWRDWIVLETGRHVERAQRRFTGGSRELWLVSLAGDGVDAELILRIERGGGVFAGTEVSLDREAVVYRALSDTAVPVPRLRGWRDEPPAMLLDRVDGTAELGSLPSEAQRAAGSSFLASLGALHGLNVDALDLAGMPGPSDAEGRVRAELERWRRIADGVEAADPVLRFGFAWLEARIPPSGGATVLVHGDAGPGNFLVDTHGTVTGLIDWEFAHLGDPMDDIAWVDMRARRVPSFGTAAERDRWYSAASGIEVDLAAVRYYAAFVRLRCAITTARTLDRGGGALGYVQYQAPHHRFRVELLQAIALAEGCPLESMSPPRTSIATPLEDRALAEYREVLKPALSGPEQRLSGRTVELTLEAQRQREALGATLAESERRDRVTVFGDRFPAAIAALAADAGSSLDPAILGYLQRHALRSLSLWATPATGVTLEPLEDPRAEST